MVRRGATVALRYKKGTSEKVPCAGVVNVIDELPREWVVTWLDKKLRNKGRGALLVVGRFQNEQLCKVLRDGLAKTGLRF